MKTSVLAALWVTLASAAAAQQPAPPSPSQPPGPPATPAVPSVPSASPDTAAAPAVPSPARIDSTAPQLRPLQLGQPGASATAAAPIADPGSGRGASPAGEFAVDRIVAVVGDEPILWSDVQEVLLQRRAQGLQLPEDSASYMKLAEQIVNELVDEHLLVQKAKAEKIEVSDQDVTSMVDQQVKTVRDRFQSDAEYREALRANGIGTPEEYRRSLVDQAKKQAMQQRLMSKMRQDGKVVPVAVTEQDVTAAFEKTKDQLPKRPATVTFRQVIVSPRASDAARAKARAKAESLLVEIRKGGNFEQIAKRESMDETTRETGGDLGWNRRGKMVPEFDQMMFMLPPGQVSPVVETTFGFHIIRVDRVQPAEVKARHILIRPAVDSADVTRAKARADSVATLWRAGASFESLAAKYHDPDEEKVIAQPFPRTELPPSYATAFEGKGANAITDPFPIEDKQRGVPKFVVAQITSAEEGGEYKVSDLRTNIREQLTEERSVRRFLDGLRKQTYVSVRLREPAGP